MDSRIPLDQLTEDERRGAMIALDHVRRRGHALEKSARKCRFAGSSGVERKLLEHAGRMVRNTAHSLRRDLSPELKDWHTR